MASEIAAQAGFDWLLIDREHGSGSEADAAQQFLAVEAGGSAPVIRVSGIHPEEIKRVLDLGPGGVMVPSVDTEEQARQTVRHIRIPPLGSRQTATSTRAVRYGGTYQQYLATNNVQLLLLVQIESKSAVESCGAIAAVEGIDVLFVGPTDLGTSMGIDPNSDSAEFAAALTTVVAEAKRHGKSAGILARSEVQARRYADLGFQVIAMGSDRGILYSGFNRTAQILASLREGGSR